MIIRRQPDVTADGVRQRGAETAELCHLAQPLVLAPLRSYPYPHAQNQSRTQAPLRRCRYFPPDIGGRRCPIDRRRHLSSESSSDPVPSTVAVMVGSRRDGPGCPFGYEVTGGPSTCGSARSAAGRCRVACSCPEAVSLAPAGAIAREWLTSAGCRACARGGRRTGRGCRTYWSRTLIIADAVASAPLVDGGWFAVAGPGRNAGVSETQNGLDPGVALAVAGRVEKMLARRPRAVSRLGAFPKARRGHG